MRYAYAGKESGIDGAVLISTGANAIAPACGA
jgi:hypothetical protein